MNNPKTTWRGGALIWINILQIYRTNQKTVDIGDDIKAVLKCIWCCHKANSFTIKLLNHLFSEMGLGFPTQLDFTCAHLQAL